VVNVFIRIVCSLAAIASGACLAASPLIVVFQQPDYPAPGQPFAYPGGVLFSVCSDGRAYRALSNADVGSSAMAGTISKGALEDLRAYLSAVRAECEAHGVALDTPSLRVEAMLGEVHEVFECSLYQEGEALKSFESLIWRVELLNTAPAKTSLCK